MKFEISRHSLMLAAAALAVQGAPLRAATIGSDHASTNAYLANDAIANDADPTNNTNGWVSGDDGFVTGAAAFQPWALSTSGTNAGFFLSDSRNLAGGTGADINSAGNLSFGLFGGKDGGVTAATANAVRRFDSALAIGQSFSIDIAVNFRNGQKGIDLRDAADVVLFNFNVGNPGTGDDYRVNAAATGNGSIGATYSANSAFNLTFTQTGAGGGNWVITRSGGVSDLDSGTYAGVPTNMKVYVSGTDGGAPNDLYVNKPTTVPEPGTPALILFSLLGLGWIRRRVSATDARHWARRAARTYRGA